MTETSETPAGGQTLRDLLAARGYIPEPDVIDIFIGVARSLEARHDQNQLHLDVKPEKIVKGPGGQFALNGFGTARLGTPKYMAPERVLHKTPTVSSDIYSLGVVLYEAATGQVPFNHELNYQVLQDHVNKTPPPPQGVRPEVSAGLQRAIITALAKDPGDRFGTAQEFREALESLLPEKQPEPAEPARAPSARVEPAVPDELQCEIEPKLEDDRRHYHKGTVPGVMSGRRPEPGANKPEPKPARKAGGKFAVASGPEPTPKPGVEPKPVPKPEFRYVPDSAPRPVPKPGPASQPAARSTGGTRKISVPVLPVVAVALVLLAAVFLVLGWRKPKVPQVAGLSVERALTATERVGLMLVVTASRDDTLAEGRVLEQLPPAGSKVVAGETLKVVISTGMVEVPRLDNLSLAAARQEAEKRGLEVAGVDTVYTDSIPVGMVAGSQPPAGARLEPGSAINLMVVQGRAVCPECGARREPGAKFCTSCGHRYEI